MKEYFIFVLEDEPHRRCIVECATEGEALSLANAMWPDEIVGCYVEPSEAFLKGAMGRDRE